MPASAKTSASPSFAQQMPTAPRAICRRASSGDLWVLACGRSRMPLARRRRLHAIEVALDARLSTSTDGVRRSLSCTMCSVAENDGLAEAGHYEGGVRL